MRHVAPQPASARYPPARTPASPGLLAAAILAVCSAVPPLAAQTRHAFTETHMGMPVRIVLYAGDAATPDLAARAAFARIAALEAALSDFRPDSEVRRLSERPGEWVPVSKELFTVLATALEVARASDGAFDPTIGPLVALWRQARREGRLPDPEAREAAHRRTGWRSVALDPDARAVRLALPDMRLDLGGVAKGYILQAALATLADHDVTRALVEAGGDVVVGDAPPGRAGWRIETPAGDAATAALAASITHAAVATSGTTAQFVEVDGTRFAHIVDPATGLGLTDGRVATVIAPDAALADALATALAVMGASDGAALLARFPQATASVRRARALRRRRTRRPRRVPRTRPAWE